MENLGALFDVLDRAEADELHLRSDATPYVVVRGGRRELGAHPMAATIVEAAALEIVTVDELEAIGSTPYVVAFANGDVDYEIEMVRTAGVLSIAIRPIPVELELEQAAGAETMSLPPAPRAVPRHATLASLKAISIVPRDKVPGSGPVTAPPPSASKKIDGLLRRVVAAQASDLHLSPGEHPVLRVDGAMQFLRDVDALSAGEIEDLLREIGTAPELVCEIERLARFRVKRSGAGAAIRCIPVEIKTAEELALPCAVADLCRLTRGLVLVAGPLGSGRSTTLAAMVERINDARAAHVVTLERPVEHVHRNKKSLVRQHEVKSFADALCDVRREDPDVVVVGELREPDAIALAIEIANAGVLVIGAVEALDSASAIDRLVEVFPVERQAQVRGQLRHTLKGAIAQRLLPKIGGGRILACETMIGGSLTTTMADSLHNLAHQHLIEPGLV